MLASNLEKEEHLFPHPTYQMPDQQAPLHGMLHIQQRSYLVDGQQRLYPESDDAYKLHVSYCVHILLRCYVSHFLQKSDAFGMRKK
ncbi:hypothetical protein D3C78_973670 [compost metagenome]